MMARNPLPIGEVFGGNLLPQFCQKTWDILCQDSLSHIRQDFPPALCTSPMKNCKGGLGACRGLLNAAPEADGANLVAATGRGAAGYVDFGKDPIGKILPADSLDAFL